MARKKRQIIIVDKEGLKQKETFYKIFCILKKRLDYERQKHKLYLQ
jgi:hypothetical protein